MAILTRISLCPTRWLNGYDVASSNPCQLGQILNTNGAWYYVLDGDKLIWLVQPDQGLRSECAQD